MRCHGVMLGAAQCRVTLMGGTLTDNEPIFPGADPPQTDLPCLQLFLPKMLQDETKVRVKAIPRRVGRRCQHGI